MSDTLETRLDGLVHRVSSLERTMSGLCEVQPNVDAYWRIIDACCQAYGLERAVIFSKARPEGVAECRHLCFYLCRAHNPLVTCKVLGKFFKKDHTSIIYGCQHIARQQTIDPRLAERLEAIRRELENEN